MLSLFSLVLGETGMRCEWRALRCSRWEDVDLENGFVQVVSGRDQHRTKSGKSRDVPLSSRLLQLRSGSTLPAFASRPIAAAALSTYSITRFQR